MRSNGKKAQGKQFPSQRMCLYGKQIVHVLFLQSRDPAGTLFYWYIAVRQDKILPLQKALISGKTFDLQHYGKVLAQGTGDPSPEVREKMRIEYRFVEGNA